MRRKIIIPKKELKRLYYKEKKSKYKIGAIYGCSFKTVLNRMRECGMKPLPRSVIQSKYEKKDFSGNKLEKAYILGFRVGDLNVYKTTEESKVIVARCNTTMTEQAELLEKIFSKYGKVSYNKKGKEAYSVNCFLNDSFDFLLPKSCDVEDWITLKNNYSASFASGYIDAEGNIGVYDGRARFKIDSYDREIIHWMYKWFVKNDIICPIPKKIYKKNQVYNKSKNYKYNEDLWRLRVSNQESLKRLFDLIYSFIKHKKRKEDIKKCLNNLNDRKKKK
ncbi:MAG: hypothetical protein U5L10_03835 [Candidatus Moranbacteria bacterium]|nr:hypothetical protein [Candidatus Moranbacteria bacterium]